MKVGYCRVSTASGEQLSALENQIARIKAAGVDRVITDVESGLSSDRPGMLELLNLIDMRKVSEVIATRVDRLGRDASATDALIVLAAKKGVRLTTLDGGAVETDTPTGFLMARISTSLAEMESRMLSQRVRRGLEQRRKRRMPCRGRAPWGYRITEDRSGIEPDPSEWDSAIRFLGLLRKCKWRMNTALEQFDAAIPLNSCRAVKAWLLNPILRGGIGWQQQPNHSFAEIAWGCHTALIDPDEWGVIQVQLAQNRRNWGANSTVTPNLLTSLCWCPNCGKRAGYAGSRKYPSVLCRTRGCVSRYKGTRESVISAAIIESLRAKAGALASFIEEEPPEAVELRNQISRLEAQGDPDLAPAIEIKRQRLEQLRQEPSAHQRAVLEALGEADAWDMATPEELRAVFLEFVARVEVDRGQVLSVRLTL
jgi:DNA invertase Pin-like site-specific DNA recombinase